MATLVFNSYRFYFLALFCAVILTPLHVWERPPKLQHHSGPAQLVNHGAALPQPWQGFPVLHLSPVAVCCSALLVALAEPTLAVAVAPAVVWGAAGPAAVKLPAGLGAGCPRVLLASVCFT